MTKKLDLQNSWLSNWMNPLLSKVKSLLQYSLKIPEKHLDLVVARRAKKGKERKVLVSLQQDLIADMVDLAKRKGLAQPKQRSKNLSPYLAGMKTSEEASSLTQL